MTMMMMSSTMSTLSTVTPGLSLQKGVASRKLVVENDDDSVDMTMDLKKVHNVASTNTLASDTSKTVLLEDDEEYDDDSLSYDEDDENDDQDLFVLSMEQLPQSAAEEDKPTLSTTSDNNKRATKKSVRFNEDGNEYHKDDKQCQKSLSQLRDVCWYTTDDIAMFRAQSDLAAVKLFGAAKDNKNNKNSSNSNNKRPLRKRLFGKGGNNNKQSDNSDGAPLSRALLKRTKKNLANTYKTSNKIRSEQEFDNKHYYNDDGSSNNGRSSSEMAEHQALVASYHEVPDHVCLEGLEAYILYGIRGDSAVQVRYILQAAKKKAANRPEQLGHWMRVISQFISLPSRVFVRELALAQADALLLAAAAQQQQQQA